MYCIILCTCPSDDLAQHIARKLLSASLAGCINIVPNVTSIYRWENEIVCDQEVQLLIKTKVSLFSEIEQEILALHPYETPEIITLPIQQGNTGYLNWIKNSVKGT